MHRTGIIDVSQRHEQQEADATGPRTSRSLKLRVDPEAGEFDESDAAALQAIPCR